MGVAYDLTLAAMQQPFLRHPDAFQRQDWVREWLMCFGAVGQMDI